MMETREAIRNRRSVRKYTSEPVSREVLQELLEDAMWSPSGVNLQPWYFVALTGEEDLGLLKEAMLETVIRITPGLKARFEKNPEVVKETAGFMNTLGGAPVCILIFNQKPGVYSGIVTDLSIGAAAQTFCLLAEDKGLGTCIMAPEMSEETAERLRQYFAPDKGGLKCMIVLGHPAVSPKAPRRKEGRWVIRK